MCGSNGCNGLTGETIIRKESPTNNAISCDVAQRIFVIEQHFESEVNRIVRVPISEMSPEEVDLYLWAKEFRMF